MTDHPKISHVSQLYETTTNLTIPYPGAPVGWTMLLLVAQKPTTYNGGGVTTPPSGWTLLGSVPNAGGYAVAPTQNHGNVSLWLYKRIADGTESGSLSVVLTGTNVAVGTIFVTSATDISGFASKAVNSAPASNTFTYTTDTALNAEVGDMPLWVWVNAGTNNQKVASGQTLAAPSAVLAGEPATVEMQDEGSNSGFRIALNTGYGGGVSGAGSTTFTWTCTVTSGYEPSQRGALAVILLKGPAVPVPGSVANTYYSSAVLSDSPRAYWRMDENLPAQVIDYSGYNIGGTRTGGTSAAGITGNAYQFTGASSTGIDCGPSNVIGTGLTAMTLECWFKSTSSATNEILVAARRYAGATGSDNYELRLTGGKVMTGFFCASGYAQFSSPLNYNDGQWHHAVGTYDGANVRLYVDGAQVATQALVGGVVNSGGTERLKIATYTPFGAANGVNATVDEVAIYRTALSAERVAEHRTAGVSPPPTNDLWVWNGTTEIPANVTVWNGTAELAAGVSVT